MKEHLFYVFLFIFLATALLTLAGIAKWIRIDHFYLRRLFAVLLLELSAAVISTYHRADFFSTPTITVAQPSTPSQRNPRVLMPHLQTPRALLDYLSAEASKPPALESDRNVIAQRVVGCVVDWELDVQNVTKSDCDTIHVIASTPDIYADICSGPLCIRHNPDVRLAAIGSKIRMHGIIASIDAPLHITLQDADVISIQ